MFSNNEQSTERRLPRSNEGGFTIIEAVTAAILMVILCVGLLTVFSYVTKINAGNNVRAQALSVLQQELEYFRSLRFLPGQETAADLPNHRSADLYEGSRSRPPVTSASGMVFNVTVEVVNIPAGTAEHLCTFKEIRITAVPAAPQQGWLSDLQTTVAVQRVRAN